VRPTTLRIFSVAILICVVSVVGFPPDAEEKMARLLGAPILVTSARCSFGTAQNPDHLGEGMRQQSTFQEKTLPPETTSTGASSGEPSV
jgi:hypothetical protein